MKAECGCGKIMAPESNDIRQEGDVENALFDNSNAANADDNCLNLVSLFGDISLT